MKSLKISTAIYLMACVGMAGTAIAQDAVDDGAATTESAESSNLELGTITVTAQKRAQSVQDIGLSVTAVTEERLAEAGVADVVEVAGLVPNVQVNYGLGNNFFNIRSLGLNEFVANLDAPVAVHVDEVYQSKGFMTGMALFDVSRVEVLRGPQGDLFGRNTTGGTVNFFTNRPQREFGAGFDVSYGNFETFNGEAYVTGPISDSVSYRLSGYRTDQGKGFYDNQLLGDDEGRVDEYALRGQLLYEGDKTDVLFSMHYGQDKSQLHPYEGVGNTDPTTGALCAEYLNGTVEGDTPNCLRGLDLSFNPIPDPNLPGQFQPEERDPFTTQNNLTFEVDNETIGGFLRVDHQLEDAVLTSITGYENFKRDQREDSDGSPIDSVHVFWNNEIKQYTQELRLTSDFDHDNWSYVLGAFYEHDDYTNNDYLTAFLPFNGLNNFSRYDQTVDAFSLFAHVESQLTDNIRLIAGARYTFEETEVEGGTFAGEGVVNIGGVEQPAVLGPVIADAALAPGGNDREDENVSYRLGAEWDVNENVLVYGNVTTGFRSGGYSVAFASAQDQLVNLDPETITSYELGFKSDLANNRFRLNGSIFRYDIVDGHIDVDVPGTPVPITINAPSAETTGAEIETVWLVTEGLELTNGFGWTDSTIEDVGNQVIGGVQVSDFSGNRRAFSPDYTFNGQARYATDISSSLEAIFTTDYSWRSDQHLELNNQPSNLIDAYWIVNARAQIRSTDGRWGVSVWGKNITDTEYVTYLNDLPAFGWLLRGYGAPATYGVSLEYNF